MASGFIAGEARPHILLFTCRMTLLTLPILSQEACALAQASEVAGVRGQEIPARAQRRCLALGRLLCSNIEMTRDLLRTRRPCSELQTPSRASRDSVLVIMLLHVPAGMRVWVFPSGMSSLHKSCHRTDPARRMATSHDTVNGVQLINPCAFIYNYIYIYIHTIVYIYI